MRALQDLSSWTSRSVALSVVPTKFPETTLFGLAVLPSAGPPLEEFDMD
jgi:hypothetical protein